METEKKNGRGKKEVSLLGLFGKKFLEETQGKLAEATGISFFIIDYKGEPVTKGEQEEDFCKLSKARREELENHENYNNLINHIDYLRKLQDCSMVNEDINGYAQVPF